MTRFLDTVFSSLTFAAILYYAFHQNVEIAQYVAIAIIWAQFILVASVVLVKFNVSNEYKIASAGYQAILYIYSIFVIVFLVNTGHWVLATVYTMSKLLVTLLVIRTASNARKNIV
jgi:hypothetical protein